MYKSLLFAATMAATLLVFGCQPPANSSTTNKPANAANSASNAAPANTAAVEAEVKKLVTDYATTVAKNNVAEFEKTTTDNFMFVSNDGSVQTKAERVASMKSGETKYESLTYDDLNVRVNTEGNGAVVIGKAVVKGINMGKPVEGANRVTQVWSKTKDGWKMASLQATPIAASAEKPPANTAASSSPANR
jgi:ketosteroid isomerase-like protein